MYELDDLIKEYGSPIGIAGVSNHKNLLPLLEGLHITIATDQDTAGNSFIYKFGREYIDRYRIEPQYITFNIEGINDINDYLLYKRKKEIIT